MYRFKIQRGRSALRRAAGALVLSVWSGITAPGARADSVFTASFGTWSTGTNWTPAGVPGGGVVADILKSVNVSYTVPITMEVDLQALQIAGGTSLSPATLTLSSSSALEAANIYLGGNTGFNGAANLSGPGVITETSGTISIDPGGVLAVDSASTFTMSSAGSVIAYNEQLNGTFTENGGSNGLAGGATLTNSGNYVLESNGALAADTIINNGVFNFSSGSVRGTSTSNTSFVNYGTLILTGTGTFTGAMNNATGALITLNASAIPFSSGVINNGQLSISGFSGNYSAPITGSGNITFSGSGTPTLSGSNVFNGSTGITGGTVTLASPAGTAANSWGGALQGNVTIGASGTLQLGGHLQIANTSALQINGGTFNLAGYNESVGTLTLQAGAVQQPSGLGLGVSSGLVFANGRYSASISGGLRTNNSSNTITFSVANGGTLTVNGAISGYAGNNSTGLILTGGGGTLAISGASLLTSLDLKNGFLQLTEGGSFGGYNASTNVESSGALELDGQIVTIGDLTGSGSVALGNGTLISNSSAAGSTYAGTINGSGSLVKNGSGTFTLTGADLATGATTVNNGAFTLASGASIGGSIITAGIGSTLNIYGALTGIPQLVANGTINFGANASGIVVRSFGSLTVGSGGQVNVPLSVNHSNRSLIVPDGLIISGATNSWAGQIDLSNNDMVVNDGDLGIMTNQVKSGFNGGRWNGMGITSTAAAADSAHLTALGVIQNNNGSSAPLYGTGAPLGLFDGYSPSVSDVLVKFTYYGDANLDGKVDGSDYSLIDTTYLTETATNTSISGWYSGDFNYDGVVNGSDYTLIDNTFNTQGASLAAIDATATAQISANGESVPEPSMLGLVGVLAAGLLKRRRGEPGLNFRFQI